MDSRGRGGKVALVVTVRPTPAERLPHSLFFAKKALSIKITVGPQRAGSCVCVWNTGGMSVPGAPAPDAVLAQAAAHLCAAPIPHSLGIWP